jgi:hypothetical protein
LPLVDCHNVLPLGWPPSGGVKILKGDRPEPTGLVAQCRLPQRDECRIVAEHLMTFAGCVVFCEEIGD